MKTQNTTNFSTLTFENNDLLLIQEALCALQLKRNNLGYGKVSDINRLYHAISLVIYNDVSTTNSESTLMNS